MNQIYRLYFACDNDPYISYETARRWMRIIMDHEGAWGL